MDDISRVTRSKEQARNAYDAMSGWYDLLAGGSERTFKEQGLRMLDVRHGEAVLEIGFGTGRSLVDLARLAGPSGRVYGVDISPGMRRRAQTLLQKSGLAGQVELKVGDAAELPFPSDSMDAVFIAFTLELFDTPEIPVVVSECRRVLRRAGRIAVVSMARGEKSSPMVGMYEWAHRAFPAWADCRPIRAQKSLEEGGFILREKLTRSMWGLPVDILLANRG